MQLSADAVFITCEPRAANEFVIYQAGNSIAATARPAGVTSVQTITSYNYTVTRQTVRAIPASTASSAYEVKKQTTIGGSNAGHSTNYISDSFTPADRPSRVTTTTYAHPSSPPSAITTTTYVVAPQPTPTPAMNVIWDSQPNSTRRRQRGAYRYTSLLGLELIASRTQSVSKPSNRIMVGAPSPSPVCGSTTTAGSALPLGLAILGPTLANSNLSAVTVPGASAPRLLKNAAQKLAEDLESLMSNECHGRAVGDSDLNWLCRDVFQFKDDPRDHPTSE